MIGKEPSIPLLLHFVKIFIQSLLDQQKQELLDKLTLGFDPVDNPCMECGDNGYERAKTDLEVLKKTLND